MFHGWFVRLHWRLLLQALDEQIAARRSEVAAEVKRLAEAPNTARWFLKEVEDQIERMKSGN